MKPEQNCTLTTMYHFWLRHPAPEASFWFSRSFLRLGRQFHLKNSTFKSSHDFALTSLWLLLFFNTHTTFSWEGVTNTLTAYIARLKTQSEHNSVHVSFFFLYQTLFSHKNEQPKLHFYGTPLDNPPALISYYISTKHSAHTSHNTTISTIKSTHCEKVETLWLCITIG